MTIVKRETIKNLKAIEGKFTCLEEPYIDTRPMGEPAYITRVSGQRVYYKVLPRNGWNEALQRHLRSETPEESEQYCMAKKLQYICDTANEAISMHYKSLDIQESIENHKKMAIKSFHQDVVQGKMNSEHQDVAFRTKKCLGELLGFNAVDIQDQQSLTQDLGADDIDLVEISIAIEEEFQIEITDQEMLDAHTVDKLIRLVQKEINNK